MESLNTEIKKFGILDRFRPHVGETLFHDFTGDDFVESKSKQFFDMISPVVEELYKGKPFKFLEIAPNKNFIAYLIADRFQASGSLFDMSMKALLAGQEIAKAKGFTSKMSLVGGDFHQLPFNSEEFDFVYMSGAIHHTFAPDIVLDEISRVLKPGGTFYMINEPVERLFSTYMFNGTRPVTEKDQVPFEQYLQEEGVLGFISYPLVGGRSEDLFGMTENWSIPVDFYERYAIEQFPKAELSYSPSPLSKFERDLVQYFDKEFFEFERFFMNKFNDVQNDIVDKVDFRSQSMGFTLPPAPVVAQMLKKVFQYVRMQKKKPAEILTDSRVLTSIFGGRIHGVYTKAGHWVATSSTTEEQTIRQLPLTYQDCEIQLNNQTLPSLQDPSAEGFFNEVFNPEDWERVFDGPAVSYINKNNSGKIALKTAYRNCVLAIRFYCIGEEQTYSLQILSDGNLLSEHEICRSESLSSVSSMATFSGKLEVRIVSDRNLPGHVRIGVLNIIPLKT